MTTEITTLGWLTIKAGRILFQDYIDIETNIVKLLKNKPSDTNEICVGRRSSGSFNFFGKREEDTELELRTRQAFVTTVDYIQCERIPGVLSLKFELLRENLDYQISCSIFKTVDKSEYSN